MRRAIIVALAFCLVGCVAGTASAAARVPAAWNIQPTPNPAGVTGSQLAGVSCPSVRSCFAVGLSSTSGQGNQPLAEHWNGARWMLQRGVKPKSSTDTELKAVSCPAAADCEAVGFYVNASGSNLALAERWNGSAWSVQRIPTPSAVLAGNPFELLAVSCVSARGCMAVGFYFDPVLDGNVIVAEHWNGTRWTIQDVATPAGSASTLLQGVACLSAARCTAVGSYTNSAGLGLTLAEAWNGTSWVIQATPSPAGATEGSALLGVSCPAPADCTATGASTDGSGNTSALAEQWNGSAWTIQGTPDMPGHPAVNFLAAVSCARPSSCSATGYFSHLGKIRPLAEYWNGTAWLLENAVMLGHRITASLQGGVSCAVPGKCTAVGFSASSTGLFTLAERRQPASRVS